jgi:hypothetical protein
VIALEIVIGLQIDPDSAAWWRTRARRGREAAAAVTACCSRIRRSMRIRRPVRD